MTTDKKTLTDVQPGGSVRLGDGWTGWATQYPNKMPKLCGAREIAELNHYPEDGQRLIFLAENPVHVGDLVDAARAALPFLAFAYSKGVDGAEEAGRAIEAALSAQPSPSGQVEMVTDAMVHAAEAAYANSKPDNLHESFRDAIAAALAARQPVGEPVAATDAMIEAALQSTVAHNASPWRQVVAAEDHADFISDMRAAINAALAALPYPLTVEATTTSTQTVPDHCDRIFWQHNYYQLPVGPADQKKPTKRRQAAVETVLSLGYLWRNDSWIAPPAQAVDLGQFREAVLCWEEAAENDLTDERGNEAKRLLALIDSHSAGGKP